MPTGGLPAKFSSETSRGEFIQLRELTETGSQAARQPDGRAQVSIGRPAPPITSCTEMAVSWMIISILAGTMLESNANTFFS